MENNKHKEPPVFKFDNSTRDNLNALLEAKTEHSYEVIATALDVNVSYVYNYVAHGIEPANKDVRKKLGITNEAAEYRRKRRAELKAKFRAAGWDSQYEYLQYVLDDKIEVIKKPLD